MLAESINDLVDDSMTAGVDKLNRYVAVDMFSTEFLNPRMSDHNLEETGLENVDLIQRTTGEISHIVSHFKNKNSERMVGLAHYLFGDHVDMRTAFRDFSIIDVIPTDRNAWMVRVLQIRKSAMRKSYDRFFKLVDDISIITDHLDENGWYPEWWLYNGAMPFSRFLEMEIEKIINEMRLLETDLPRLTRDSDLVIDSNVVVFDDQLGWLPDLERTLGISLNEGMRMKLRYWVLENRKMMRDLGLEDLMHMDLSEQDIRTHVSDRLIAAYNRMEW